jgi:hypothetical protein
MRSGVQRAATVKPLNLDVLQALLSEPVTDRR